MFGNCYQLLAMCWIISSISSSYWVHGEEYFKSHCANLINTKALNACCNDGVFWAGMVKGKDCSQYTDKSCFYDCIFTQWQLIAGNHSIDINNVDSMINHIYNGINKKNDNYVKMLHSAFKACDIASKNGLFFQLFFSDEINDKCADAMHFIKCMSITTFLNCPRNVWHSSVDCEFKKNELSYCVQMFRDIADHDLQRRSGALRRHKRDRESTSHWYMTFFNWLIF